MDSSYEHLQETMNGYLNKVQVEEVHKAYLFSLHAHEGQYRKSGEPYIIHPIAVAQLLAEQNLPPNVLIAGLLHDVIEDTEVTSEAIIAKFGKTIDDIVDGVTKLGNIEGMSTDQAQSENHRKIILATANDIRVILVKLADRVHNMKTINFMNLAKQKVIANETLEVYAPIAHRLGMYAMKWELEDLSFRCLNREAYDEIATKINMKRSEREEFVENVLNSSRELLNKNGIEATVYGRTKHIYSIFASMKKRNKTFDELTDLFAFRIVVNSIPECYSTLGLIHENFRPIPLRFKDYIPTPKHNMYQSIHTTVITNKGVQIEFQIRTKEMDVNAEFGVAAHWMYKEDVKAGEIQDKINNQLGWLKQVVENNQELNSREFMSSVKEDYLSNSIIVYTPKGDVIEIPEGSTVLDFAYYVHSRIGHQAVSGKVNDGVVSLFYPLTMGDVVHVITSKVSEPSLSSIAKVKTLRAKDGLKKYFRNMEKQKLRNEGYKLLINYSKEHGIVDIKELLTTEYLEKLFIKFNVSGQDEFYYELGVGEIGIEDVFNIINDNKSTKHQEKQEKDIYIKNAKNPYSTIICRFCSPLPGDAIYSTYRTGYYSNNEYIIHRHGCLVGIVSNEAKWNNVTTDEYVARMNFTIQDLSNSIAQTLAIFKNNNITSINFRASLGEQATGKISAKFNSLKHFNDRLEEFEKLENVIEVERRFDKEDKK